jgi:ABC-type polysaccharide/polyol phosphate export permease
VAEVQATDSAMAMARPSQLKRAIADVWAGVLLFELWGMLGWQDVRQRYRRSILGPWWLTLSTAVMIFALGLVYHAILKMPLEQYLPYLATGLVVWTLISSIINDGCQAFIGSEQIIKQIRLPFTMYACRLVWRNLIIFFHNVLIVAIVDLIFNVSPKASAIPQLILGIALIAANGVWIVLLVGAMAARFRDIPPIVNSAMQLFFFVTPIIWHPDSLPGRQRVITFNPFHHFIEIVRAPLLGTSTPTTSWFVVVAITLLGWIMTLAFMATFRRRFAYWV